MRQFYRIFLLLLLSKISYANQVALDQVILEELPHDADQVEQPAVSKLWHLGIGNYFDLPLVYQVTSTGKKNQYEFWPIINGGRTYYGQLYDKFLWQWNIMLSMPKAVGTSDLTRTVLSIDLLLGHYFNYIGSFVGGLSIFEQFLFYRQTGEVQTEGTNASGRFHRPTRLVVISQQTLTLGYASPKLANHYSLDFKSYIFSLWKSQEREFSYALNVMYQW